jgi:hypothetical protein
MALPLSTPAQRRPRLRPWTLALVAAASLAFVAGRVSGGPKAERAGSTDRGTPAGGREPWAAPAGAAPSASAPAPVLAAPSAAPNQRGEGTPSPRSATSLRGAAPPEVVARAREDAVAAIEAQRRQVVASCWPRGGLSNGRARTTLTYHVTFDREGREVARGLMDDRSAPAGEFARCLRRLPNSSLSVSRTGTYVTMKLPVTYP